MSKKLYHVKKNNDCDCSNNYDKKVSIEYLYLDLKVCDRCMGTDSVLEDVLVAMLPVLEMAGYKVEFKKVEINTIEMANKYHFVSSPTIHVDGQDIFNTVEENNCSSCSELSNSNVDCRVYSYNGKVFEVPPKEMLADNILKAIFGNYKLTCNSKNYVLPSNLEKFFSGKLKKGNCSCGDDCC